MSTAIGNVLPGPVLDRIGPQPLDRHRSLVVPLITNGADGFPHVALLSSWDVVAPEPGRLRLAIGASSRSAANLRERRCATLLVADREHVFYVKVRTAQACPTMQVAPWNAIFEGTVDQVLSDAANPAHEGRSHLLTGMTMAADPAQARSREMVRAELAGRQP